MAGYVMNRDQVIAILKAHELELRNAGVEHLSLFGSVARGEARRDSDVDLLARFNRQLSILDVVGIERRLSDILGSKVELAQEGYLKPVIKERVEQEAVLAF